MQTVFPMLIPFRISQTLVAGLLFGTVVGAGSAMAGNPLPLVPVQMAQSTGKIILTSPAAPKPALVPGEATDESAPLEAQAVPAARAPRALISPKVAAKPSGPKQLMVLPVSALPSSTKTTTPAVSETKIVLETKTVPETKTVASSAAGDVVVRELVDLDPSSVGLLEPNTGGFGPQMWQGSDRQRIEALLPRLPMGSLSPTMQDLARRLLLSSTAVPAGKATAPSLLGLRVERLAAGGLTEETNQLLRLVPAQLNDPAFTRAEMEGLLLAGDRASFCVRIEGLVGEDSNPYWLKGLAFCKALEGEVEAVGLAVSILRDQGVTGDEVFFTLAQALTGDEKAQVQSLIDPTPLQLAMLRAAQQPLPADAVPGASPGILRAEATMANADIEIRLSAAEKAETAGAFSTDLLSQIYGAIQFSEDDLQNWQAQKDSLRGPRFNALMYQVANVETDIQRRVTVLQAAWQRTRDNGGFGSMARVTHDMIRVIEPADDLVHASVDIARALLKAGDIANARRWFDYVRDLALLSAATDRPTVRAAKAVLDLWPLIQLADNAGELGWNPDAAKAWSSIQVVQLSEAVAAERTSLLFILFDALGYALPDTAWDPLLHGSLTVTAYVSSPALIRSLEGAALEGRLGETVLLGLLALGDVGPAGAAPSTLRDVIRAFNTVGLHAESRALALEAVLGRGF